MARFPSALLRLKTTDLWKIALALKASVQQKSNYRRIQRFLAEYEVDFAALGNRIDVCSRADSTWRQPD